ncbi:MAG: DivIVA domain-containing protein [Acidimicrobiales bacterium]
MELTPQLLAEVEFRDTLRGYDRDEVDTFLEQVGVAIAQLQGRLGEATTRAEMAEARTGGATGSEGVTTDTITRTLLLAQHTADATVAEAEADATRMLDEAREEASRLRAEAEADRAAVVAETENEARQVAEEARRDLLADLEVLESDRDAARLGLDQLQGALDRERARLREAAAQLSALAEGGSIGDPAADHLAAEVSDEPAADVDPSSEDPASSEPASDDAALADDRADDELTEDPADDPTESAAAGDDLPSSEVDEIDLSERSAPFDIEAQEADVDLSEVGDEPAGMAPNDPAPGTSVFGDAGSGPATQAVDVLALDDEAEGEDGDVFVQQLRQAVSSDGEHEGEVMAEFFESDDTPKRLFGRSSD